jgi:hypothetical protein
LISQADGLKGARRSEEGEKESDKQELTGKLYSRPLWVSYIQGRHE